MKKEAFRDEIKLRLTGNILELEIDDVTLDRIIDAALREIQRYICSTELITIPFRRCIDLSDKEQTGGKKLKVSSVSRIYRTSSVGDTSTSSLNPIDPMYASQWQLLSGSGNLANFQDYMYNYASWNTLLQIRNASSTDLAFRYDKSSNKLYINVSGDNPGNITIEYVPRYDSVKDITSDYWIDMTMQLAVALTKVTVGRIRSRYTQSNALWTQDGAEILQEGNDELNLIREKLEANSQLVYPVD
jgi:hypothetical protein